MKQGTSHPGPMTTGEVPAKLLRDVASDEDSYLVWGQGYKKERNEAPGITINANRLSR